MKLTIYLFGLLFVQMSCAKPDVEIRSEIASSIKVDISSCERIKDETLLTREEILNGCEILKVYIYKDNFYTLYEHCVSVQAAIVTDCDGKNKNCEWSDNCEISEGDFWEKARFIGYIELKMLTQE